MLVARTCLRSGESVLVLHYSSIQQQLFQSQEELAIRMQFDQILALLGDFGPYQRRIFFLICLLSVPGAFHKLAQVFLGAGTDHWCAEPEWEDQDCMGWNLTTTECQLAKKNASIPRDERGEFKQCGRYNVTGVMFYPGLDTSNFTTEECMDGWVYDTSQYESTIRMDFTLVCDRKTFSNVAQSVFFVGILLGSVVFGSLADWIGRTKTMYIAMCLWLAASIAVAFSPNFAAYTIFRALGGAGSYGTFLPAYVLGTEFVGPSKRVIVGIVGQIFFSAGLMILAGLAYFIRQWRTLELVITAPILLFFLYIPIFPESARWLINRGRHNQAEKIIRKVAKVNKKELPDVLFEEDEIKELKEKLEAERKPNALDLFKTPNIAFKTSNLMFNWCVNSLVYYGLSLSIPDLASDNYLAFFISGAIEIPAYILAMVAIEKLGRRLNLGSTMVIGGVACVGTILIPAGTWQTAVAMIGKFCVSASFAIVYIYSAELFPTPLRTVGMGVCSMASRIGGIVSPLILLLDGVWQPLPLLLFGVPSILAGALAFLLPETRGKALPETVEDAEEFGKFRWMDQYQFIHRKKDESPVA
ncbi:organic cation transporter protein-like isoform X2 [Acanthaster planci]|uniref:Organic cation transporter protein-like isoform X2 n=1 Tax=Acanthaster planci TaxID=133434 RepID=A0A8B7Y9H1_ACAPL|nr:organic cation transporter protein-like isoform X2 [Acanthaster planci]